MLNVEECVNIRDHCTLKVGGNFRYFTKLIDKSLIPEVFVFGKEKNLPILPIGSGSNMVFNDSTLDVVALKMEIRGFKKIGETGEYADIQVGAGENWDSVVGRTVDMGLSGIEPLSAIPGTVGATPVQNVGAYGREVKDVILSVEVYDTKKNTFTSLSNSDCKFAYRDSIFKNEARGRYIITSVTYRLSKSTPAIPDYPGVKSYFIEKKIENPSLTQIREAIISIRVNKLPNPIIIPNVGSFFKNPIVEVAIANKLKESYKDIPVFPVDVNVAKIPAGWLIEQAGLKDHSFGEISTYKNNALVLVNNGKATHEDVVRAKDEIVKKVNDTFGIVLETEPEFV